MGDVVKKIAKCRVTIFVLLGWIALSVLGYMGKDSVYQKYTLDLCTTPYFVLVLEGIRDGVYSWSQVHKDFIGQWNEVPTTEGQEFVTEEAVVETETEEGPKEFVNVEEDYFDDAVFIGDSRTVGLHDYGGLDKATFYATVGLNIYDMWQQEFCEVNGKKMTLEEALSKRQFKKVYFQIGINEMGRGTLESFIQAYRQSVAKFQELQPDAIIYVQGIMRVTKEKSEDDAIFNNQGINARNEQIAKLADNQKIFYIDVNDVVCDEEGNLEETLTFDELHLYGSKYYIWVDFLKTKGIE